jgi:H+-translocating NAD(P) transhydrogenase subunit alpha
MQIGIPREVRAGETRVALVPSLIPPLIKANHTILIESNAGAGAHISDEAYTRVGATIVPDALALYDKAEVIFKVNPPELHPTLNQHEADLLKAGTTYLGFLAPFVNHSVVEMLAKRKITTYAMEMVPRISRAQSMDALSAMATVAGYKAILLAADHQSKMFPLLMTAAGTVTPANILVLGVGVAGLQAIATGKRLGARVKAFDPRPAVKEQVQSLGAQFISIELGTNVETSGGYARALADDLLERERAIIGELLPQIDSVICTAQVFGGRAPLLITEEMLSLLRPGSVVVDLAVEQGGNCALAQPDETIDHNGVKIIGAGNLAATLPVDASSLYGHTIVELFRYLYPTKGDAPGADDPIATGTRVTHDGAIVHESIRQRYAEEALHV